MNSLKIFVGCLFWAIVNTVNGISFNLKEVGSRFASPQQFPYQVSLRRKYKKSYVHTCGGSIISQRKVLTAAHCVTDEDGSTDNHDQFQVLAGTINRTQVDGDYPGRPFLTLLTALVVHPKFDFDNLIYDVALLQATRKFRLDDSNIAIVPMSSESQLPGETKCVITGWGYVHEPNFPIILRYAEVYTVPMAQCRQRLKSLKLSNQTICALGRHTEDASRGDSGGPMVCGGKLVGVVSFGTRKPKIYSPGVYVRVAAIREWAKTANDGWSSKLSCGFLVFVHLGLQRFFKINVVSILN